MTDWRADKTRVHFGTEWDGLVVDVGTKERAHLIAAAPELLVPGKEDEVGGGGAQHLHEGPAPDEGEGHGAGSEQRQIRGEEAAVILARREKNGGEVASEKDEACNDLGAVKSGQYEDVYTPSVRILFDNHPKKEDIPESKPKSKKKKKWKFKNFITTTKS